MPAETVKPDGQRLMDLRKNMHGFTSRQKFLRYLDDLCQAWRDPAVIDNQLRAQDRKVRERYEKLQAHVTRLKKLNAVPPVNIGLKPIISVESSRRDNKIRCEVATLRTIAYGLLLNSYEELELREIAQTPDPQMPAAQVTGHATSPERHLAGNWRGFEVQEEGQPKDTRTIVELSLERVGPNQYHGNFRQTIDRKTDEFPIKGELCHSRFLRLTYESPDFLIGSYFLNLNDRTDELDGNGVGFSVQAGKITTAAIYLDKEPRRDESDREEDRAVALDRLGGYLDRKREQALQSLRSPKKATVDSKPNGTPKVSAKRRKR